jgi:ribosomal protein L30
MSTMLRITQVGSPIGRTQDQRATVRSLGLRRIRHTVIQADRPEIRGMIRKVAHLVAVEEISVADAERFAAERDAARTPKPAPKGPRAKDLARAAVRAKRTEKAAPKVKASAPAEDVVEDAAGDEPAKAEAKKTVAKRTAAKKAPAKKATAKKAPAKKTAAKKTAAKKTAAKKSTKKSEG